MSKAWTVLLTIVTGTATGFAGMLLGREVTSREVEAAAPTTEASDVLRLESRGTRSQDQSLWLRTQHERRLQQLETKLEALKDAPRAHDDDDGVAVEQTLFALDPEASRNEAFARWSERLDRHEIEPIDPAWSSATARLFEQDVAALGNREEFELVRTQCKTTTCSVKVQWKSYARALEHYTSLLHQHYAASCARDVLLPEPEERDAPYQATVLYDCARFRAAATVSNPPPT